MWELPSHKLCLSICGLGESGDRLTLAAKARPLCSSKPDKASDPLASTEMKNLLSTVHSMGSRQRKSWRKNLSFGDQEHISLQIKYNPSIGIYSLDFYVVLGRPGFTITDKKHRTACIVAKHRNRISKEEAMHWFLQKHDGIMLPGK
ncbi:hypothetical protein GH733_002761 [Mirounga leonina]|nr:hypothetical protein GH733_002761 [Mirounga leonina]